MNIVNQRSKIYGDFKDIAIVSQIIKDMYYVENNSENDAVINEAFEMIAHKMARIISGGSNYLDNWRDIIGYSKLVIDYLKDEANEAIDSKVIYLKKEPGRDWKEMKDD